MFSIHNILSARWGHIFTSRWHWFEVVPVASGWCCAQAILWLWARHRQRSACCGWGRGEGQVEKSRTVFRNYPHNSQKNTHGVLDFVYVPTRFKPDFVFSVSMFPILTLCSCVHDVLGSLLSKHHWRPLCCTHYWNHHPVAGATWQQAVSFWQRNEKKNASLAKGWR